VDSVIDRERLGILPRDPNQIGYEARRPWLFSCTEANCFWHISCASEEDAIRQQQEHACPWWGGETKVSWTVTRTLVEQMWDKLDTEFYKIVHDGLDSVENKARARAIAECIAIFSPPHFRTADEVVAEAKRRYEAEQADEEYETPGIGSRRYEIAEQWNKDRRTDGYTTDPNRTKPAAPSVNVDQKTSEAIRFASESGMFTEEQIAKTYGISVAVVKQVLEG
jgi:hypothetical protein